MKRIVLTGAGGRLGGYLRAWLAGMAETARETYGLEPSEIETVLAAAKRGEAE